MKLAVLFHRLGPYHVARLNETAKGGHLIAVELSGAGGEYAWGIVATDAFQRITVYREGDSNDIPTTQLSKYIARTLDKLHPDVLAIAGWSDRGMLMAACWALRNRVPMVLMSDSQWHDEPRRWWKEWVKRRVITGFGAALVAGSPHVAYLVRLGMSRRKIYAGYDVVDNNHFASGAEAIKKESGARSRLNLPERYFLASARFVPKKNLPVLLDAYAEYRKTPNVDLWDLVILGDGPLRAALEAKRLSLGLRTVVHLPGFKQYEELPQYYGLASAFVLPSLQDQWGLVVNEAMATGLPVLVSDVCGCVPDLIQDQNTGFLFPPTNTALLAELMAKMSGDPTRTAEHGQSARELIAAWSLERFATAMWDAAKTTYPPPRSAMRDLILKLLSRF